MYVIRSSIVPHFHSRTELHIRMGLFHEAFSIRHKVNIGLYITKHVARKPGSKRSIDCSGIVLYCYSLKNVICEECSFKNGNVQCFAIIYTVLTLIIIVGSAS